MLHYPCSLFEWGSSKSVAQQNTTLLELGRRIVGLFYCFDCLATLLENYLQKYIRINLRLYPYTLAL